MFLFFKKINLVIIGLMSMSIFVCAMVFNSDVSVASSKLCLSEADISEYAEATSSDIVIDSADQKVVVTNSSGKTKDFSYTQSGSQLCFPNTKFVLFLY